MSLLLLFVPASIGGRSWSSRSVLCSFGFYVLRRLTEVRLLSVLNTQSHIRSSFTPWLLEVKDVNLDSLPPWYEKKMFKDFMRDHNIHVSWKRR
ncbi:hypothetical protein AALP_AA4G181200 [Arabis alpina]|uniref:Uncharacterized protein n=1 Tax=Arabis alpina TaxID=50452 RepID=A0A087H410_ARAAL|nr:hypothetical protein AALP_AA4G181200 [Arabis alpina]